MDDRTQRFDALMRCLLYPVSQSAAHAREAADLWTEAAPELSERLTALAAWLGCTSLGEAEERYTRVFDLNPTCSLHVGYHLFEDTYARGALLAGLVGERNRVGLIAVTNDLPDFLPEVLRLLARLSDDDARELAASIVLPALIKIRTALSEEDTPWVRLLEPLAEVISDELGVEAAPAPREEVPHA
ncbi:MAG: molecular chaperone TorD family protein [Planctomycetota bacterium]